MMWVIEQTVYFVFVLRFCVPEAVDALCQMLAATASQYPPPSSAAVLRVLDHANIWRQAVQTSERGSTLQLQHGNRRSATQSL